MNTKQNNNAKKDEALVEYEVEGQTIQLTPSIVQQYIVGNNNQITTQEFIFFTQLCKSRKLNPFIKEAYLIKYSEKQPAQLVVSKDVILKRAVLHPQYDGKQSGIIIKDVDGAITERPGCFWNSDDEELLGGWCRVFRKDWTHPEYMSVSLDEVGQKSNGSLNTNWASKTATMLEKVAKVRALREAFVEEFSGMYIEDEFEKPSEPKKQETEVIDPLDVTAEVVKTLDAAEEIDINAI